MEKDIASLTKDDEIRFKMNNSEEYITGRVHTNMPPNPFIFLQPIGSDPSVSTTPYNRNNIIELEITKKSGSGGKKKNKKI